MAKKILREIHPYGEFIPKKARAMIVGSFPIGKFTDPSRRHEIKPHEHDFFFGGEKNLLWKLLGDVFNWPVRSKKEIQQMLEAHGLAVGDVIQSCCRRGGGASDSDLFDIKWNENLLKVLSLNKISKVYFTSRKVAVWFNKLFPESDHLEKVTLISPSGQSVRSLGKRADFKLWEKSHFGERKFNFILWDYQMKFKK